MKRIQMIPNHCRAALGLGMLVLAVVLLGAVFWPQIDDLLFWEDYMIGLSPDGVPWRVEKRPWVTAGELSTTDGSSPLCGAPWAGWSSPSPERDS